MGQIFIYPGMGLTDEQKKRLEELDKIPDEEIDLSDIPEITDEEVKRMRRAKDFFDERRAAN